MKLHNAGYAEVGLSSTPTGAALDGAGGEILSPMPFPQAHFRTLCGHLNLMTIIVPGSFQAPSWPDTGKRIFYREKPVIPCAQRLPGAGKAI